MVLQAPSPAAKTTHRAALQRRRLAVKDVDGLDAVVEKFESAVPQPLEVAAACDGQIIARGGGYCSIDPWDFLSRFDRSSEEEPEPSGAGTQFLLPCHLSRLVCQLLTRDAVAAGRAHGDEELVDRHGRVDGDFAAIVVRQRLLLARSRSVLVEQLRQLLDAHD